MITQNLFNKKPKTFMDYEPGKLPSKKDWDTQTKTETKAYGPFVSNVKLVGDDITEKDYDTFFEGFTDPYGEKANKNEKRSLQISVQVRIIEPGILRVHPLHKQMRLLKDLIKKKQKAY